MWRQVLAAAVATLGMGLYFLTEVPWFLGCGTAGMALLVVPPAAFGLGGRR